MTTLAERPVAARFRLFPDLERPGQVFAWFTPNWFASVMGTGIVAIAAATLPYHPEGLRGAAIAVWALAVALLLVAATITTVQWVRYPQTARGHLTHPVMAYFHGAVPMAMLTVGAATALVGRDVIGASAAIGVDAVLWSVGTVAGLVTAVVVPLTMFRAGNLRPDKAFGGWLMAVVPPMVSASTGALLLPHAPAGWFRTALLVACYAMFVVALAASCAGIVAVARRVVIAGVGPAVLVPTLWIVLGPLGQSATAADLLGGVAHDALPAGTARALQVAGFAYAVVAWTLALAWGVFAVVVTVRTARVGLPFSLAWWSFTFPVGTVVTATSGLALHTGAAAFALVAAALYVGLVGAWITVLSRTARAAARGWVFLPPPR